MHNSFQYFFIPHTFFFFTKNTYLIFLKSFFHVTILADKCSIDTIRSSKPRYNRSIILNIDDSKDMSVLINQQV